MPRCICGCWWSEEKRRQAWWISIAPATILMSPVIHCWQRRQVERGHSQAPPTTAARTTSFVHLYKRHQHHPAGSPTITHRHHAEAAAFGDGMSQRSTLRIHVNDLRDPEHPQLPARASRDLHLLCGRSIGSQVLYEMVQEASPRPSRSSNQPRVLSAPPSAPEHCAPSNWMWTILKIPLKLVSSPLDFARWLTDYLAPRRCVRREEPRSIAASTAELSTFISSHAPLLAPQHQSQQATRAWCIGDLEGCHTPCRALQLLNAGRKSLIGVKPPAIVP
ncbi:hypothetical protein PCL_02819 [Purpureocillium lilacinum]|uniref:Uncharacterized protein n=1 Tax=Purpureocillium lilacinum TaxID=33203 RepID=A0A2U3DYX8_PURLI|nr:hypothetical protein PCL_02819 [Purpureocillium lilacinum]